MRLYGSLVLAVSIRSDGSLEGVEVRRSSGQRVLDAAAIKIVRHVGAVRGVSRRHPARHRHPHRRADLDVHQGRRAHQQLKRALRWIGWAAAALAVALVALAWRTSPP